MVGCASLKTSDCLSFIRTRDLNNDHDNLTDTPAECTVLGIAFCGNDMATKGWRSTAVQRVLQRALAYLRSCSVSIT